MKDKSPSNFRFQFDNETPDDYLQTEIQDIRYEKLSHRITLLFILLPLLLVVVAAIAYLDIQKRVDTTRNTGEQGVESLSKNLESRFSSLSVQNAKMEESLTKLQELFTQKAMSMDEIIGEFEKMNTYLKNELKKIKSTLQTVQTGQTSKIDRKEVAEALTKTGEALTSLGTDIKGVRSKIKVLGKITSDLEALDNDVNVLDKKLTQELVKLSTNIDKDKKTLANLTQTVGGEKQKLTDMAQFTDIVKKDMAQLKKDLSGVSSGKMDKELMEFILKKHQQNFMATFDKSMREIRNNVTSLQKKVRGLEKASRYSIGGTRSKPVATKPQKSEPKSTKKATKKPAPQKPRNITEQDIRQ